VTDSERRVVWQADVHDNGAADVLPASTIELPLRASNQYFDAETGLHYNLNRYLDAVRGRYLSPDPLGLATGPDLYQFALGRPHQFIDVLGLQTTSTDWSQKSQTDRLIAIIQASIPKMPRAIGSALAQLVQPAAVAQTVALLALFGAAQATPAGWVADAAIFGWSAWQLGSGVVELAKTLAQLYKDAQNATCDAAINAAAQRLANSFVGSGGQIAAGLMGVLGVVKTGGATRIASGLDELIDVGDTTGIGGSTAATGATIAADVAAANDSLVVIGRQVDTAVAKDWPGHAVLDLPASEWSIAANDAWVQQAINARQSVYLASPTTEANLFDSVAGRSTVFGRELQQFLSAGYTRVGDYLIPPDP
jgi:RHS repeat-associated protein